MPNIPNNKSALWKKHCELDRPLPVCQTTVTSNPDLAVTSGKLPRTRLSGVPEFKIELDCPLQDILVRSSASQEDNIKEWIKHNLPSCNQPKERVSSTVSLSSTSSCDMYTNTDISDDEQEHDGGIMQNLHPKSTIMIIELIIRKIELNLRYAAQRQRTGDNNSSARSGAEFTPQQGSRKSSQCSGHKRKSRREGTPPLEDDDEDGPHKRRRGSATTTTDDSETGARFACPFYKHDPDRYRSRRTCPGPGWPTVHRMKEHLYRSHSQPIFCPICYTTSKSDKEQLNHVRLQQCQRSLPQQIEGIDRDTVWTLRKRTTALRLEEDKWRDVYQVLFPDVSAADIPSPFYDCDSPSEASRRFRRELLRRVHEELLIEVGQVPGPIEQQLLQRVAQIIRRCEHELLSQGQPSPTLGFCSDRRASNSSIASVGSVAAGSLQVTPVLARVHAMAHSHVNLPQYPIPPTQETMQHIPDPTVDFSQVVWDDQTYSAFSLGIEWDGIFPPAPETQQPGNSNEFFTAFSAMKWT
ncbi:hypothetical protein EJ02DRAFT_270547 [Clathrospora elynae]|uniref:Uncharacterized protein n=1 Tax=Clathrospora elynae TaxID=706981 RepID=A0A6A5SNN2_9PLEO|nr:hypothetical protein EJ02DRAFT_270547 [Clathrospora elynae]